MIINMNININISIISNIYISKKFQNFFIFLIFCKISYLKNIEYLLMIIII